MRAGPLPLVLSLAAFVLAGVALGLTLSRQSASQGADACQAAAWNSIPSAASLPAGWSVTSTGFFVDSVSSTLVGPAPSDQSTDQPRIFVTVGCYGSSGHDALARSHSAALANGETDTTLPELGDESFATRDDTAGSISVYVRRGVLLASLAASSSLDLSDLETAAAAVDAAMRHGQTASGGGASASPAAASTSPGASPSSSPSASVADQHVAPDLEALLPGSFQGTALEKDSSNGSTAVGTDKPSQALVDALKGFGKTPSDLRIAEAFDSSGTLDLSMLAFQVKGVDAAHLRAALTSGWLSGGASGVTSSKTTIGKKAITKLTYTDGPSDYLYEHGDVVFDVVSTDPDTAKAALALLP